MDSLFKFASFLSSLRIIDGLDVQVPGDLIRLAGLGKEGISLCHACWRREYLRFRPVVGALVANELDRHGQSV